MTVAPVVLRVGRVEVEEQRGEPDGGAEHDAGREVAPARALDADQLHRAGRDRGCRPRSPTAARRRRRNAPEPPVVPMSPKASPAKDCPRMTVNTPTTPATIGDDGAHAEARCGRLRLGRSRARRAAATDWLTRAISPAPGKATSWPLRSAVLAGAGDDEHAAVHVEHVDVVAVELAEHVRAHDLGGRCR